MKTRTLLLSASLLLGACGGRMNDGADAFREGLPSSESVKLNVPGSSGQALTGGQVRQGLEGEESGMYKLTRGATVIVNGSTVAVLKLIEEVVEHPPTSLEGNTAVWGPHSQPLAKNAWRLTVTRVEPGVHDYVLEGRPKADEAAAFVTVLSGRHTTAQAEDGSFVRNFGSGSFTLDWDGARTLPEHDGNVGSADFTYSRTSASAEARVDVDFTRVKDSETQQVVDAAYRYRATPGSGGTFDFSVLKSLDTQPANEKLTIRSRWEESGAGRSDVRAEGGDFAQQHTFSECWDTAFSSVYLTASFSDAPEANYGTTDACAFATAEYSAL
jgi:hypothetical protein